MIRETLSLADFRADGTAVNAWKAFLETPEGKKVAQCLRGQHPLVLLSDTVKDPRSLRDSAITESSVKGISENLLGKVAGYELCLKAMDEMLTPLPSDPELTPRTSTRMAQTLRGNRQP